MPHDIQQILSQHYLFTSFEPAQLAELAGHVRPLRLPADSLLFSHGDPADRFFLVVSGQVKLFRTTPDGQEKVMELIGPGRTFGEAIMFMEQQRYPVSAQALKDSMLLAIPNRRYLQLVRNNPDACLRLLGDLSMRLHQRLNEVENLSLQNAGHRVARYLLKRLPPGGGDGTVLQLDAPKQVIASQLGMKPETFSRVLGALTQQGAITVKGRQIVIASVALLTNPD